MKAPLIMLLLVGCGAAPENPTWLVDVRPILAANCIRCHGYPAIGGAPSTFRLDVYEDGFIDGRTVRGAKSMAEFISARGYSRGDMPPRGAKPSSAQRETFEKWMTTTEIGTRASNADPTAQATDVDSNADPLMLDVLVSDADRDLVFGELRYESGAENGVIGPLHAGRQALFWDTGVVPPGTYNLVASLDDGGGARDVPLGTRTIADRGNTAPRFDLLAPLRDTLLHDRDGLVRISFMITDPDPPNRHTLDLEAFHGDVKIAIATDLHPGRGMGMYDWNISGVPEGSNWRIRATVSDGTATRVFESSPIIVSHAQTSETYDSVKPLIDGLCARCHFGPVDPGPDFAKYEDLKLYSGKAWRKMWQLREMPPKSMSVILTDPPTFSEADRARLAAWFLAGAPQ